VVLWFIHNPLKNCEIINLKIQKNIKKTLKKY